MKKSAFIVAALFILSGCGKDTKPHAGLRPYTGATTVTPTAKPPQRYEPARNSTETQGTVVLNGNSYTVVTQFTDNVAFRQQAINMQGQADVLFYHEKLVHLISSGTDTITLNKALFKRQLPDYESMILMGVHLDMRLKTRVAPFMVYFCMPDSDYCYHFEVGIAAAGGISIKEIDERDFEGYEE
jgi:hypothetical protein